MPPPYSDRKPLTAAEVATRLGVEKQFVYRHKKSLGEVHVGRAVRFPERRVEWYVAGAGADKGLSRGYGVMQVPVADVGGLPAERGPYAGTAAPSSNAPMSGAAPA